jgi:hypothetical protein
MSSQMFFHSIHDQLAVVLGTTELLALASQGGTNLEHCKKIKTAALNLHELIKEFQRFLA